MLVVPLHGRDKSRENLGAGNCLICRSTCVKRDNLNGEDHLGVPFFGSRTKATLLKNQQHKREDVDERNSVKRPLLAGETQAVEHSGDEILERLLGQVLREGGYLVGAQSSRTDEGSDRSEARSHLVCARDERNRPRVSCDKAGASINGSKGGPDRSTQPATGIGWRPSRKGLDNAESSQRLGCDLPHILANPGFLLELSVDFGRLFCGELLLRALLLRQLLSEFFLPFQGIVILNILVRDHILFLCQDIHECCPFWSAEYGGLERANCLHRNGVQVLLDEGDNARGHGLRGDKHKFGGGTVSRILNGIRLRMLAPSSSLEERCVTFCPNPVRLVICSTKTSSYFLASSPGSN